MVWENPMSRAAESCFPLLRWTQYAKSDTCFRWYFRLTSSHTVISCLFDDRRQCYEFMFFSLHQYTVGNVSVFKCKVIGLEFKVLKMIQWPITDEIVRCVSLVLLIVTKSKVHSSSVMLRDLHKQHSSCYFRFSQLTVTLTH